MVSLDEAGGNNCNNIRAYVSNYYENTNLKFLLLVGDFYDITPHSRTTFSYSDNWFGLLEGDDFYEEVLVGRFSVESVQDVETHVNKVIYYERDMPAHSEWLYYGMAIASRDGEGYGHYGESDKDHIVNILRKYAGYSYWIFRQHYERFILDGPYTEDIVNDFNDGIGLCNYCSHSSLFDYWPVGNFTSEQVNALENDYMWPMIISVASKNGKFDESTPCFAEAWMRATNNNTHAPTGAIGGMFSFTGISCVPPQFGQDEMADIFTEEKNLNLFNHTMGGYMLNGNQYILDMCPEDEGETHNTWFLFGDPSLMVRSDEAHEMDVTFYPKSPVVGMGELDITLGWMWAPLNLEEKLHMFALHRLILKPLLPYRFLSRLLLWTIIPPLLPLQNSP